MTKIKPVLTANERVLNQYGRESHLASDAVYLKEYANETKELRSAYEALQKENAELKRNIANALKERKHQEDSNIKLREESAAQAKRIAELEAATEHLGLTSKQAADGLARHKARGEVMEAQRLAIIDLQKEIESRTNSLAAVVKSYDQKLLDAEKVLQESNSTWHQLLTLEEARVKELEQAASINQEYVTEMHRINGMAISAGLEVPNPNSPYFSERSAIAYLQRQSYEQGWKDGNNNVKLMDHKD